MKVKKVIGVVVIMLILSPISVSASTFPTLLQSYNINKDCRLVNGDQFSPIWGCYNADTNQIVINALIPPPIDSYILLHEVGAYYLRNTSPSTLQALINPYPDLEVNKSINEIADDHFASWLLNKKSVSTKEQQFYSNLLN